MTMDLRDLLTEVAEGRLDPAEASRRLNQPPTEPTAPPGAHSTAAAPPTAADTVRRVSVSATGRSVRLVADPTVATVSVEGQHALRQDGDTLHIGPAPSSGAGEYRQEGRGGLSRWLSGASVWGSLLTVRVNPDLPVEAEVMAGSLRVNGLRAPLTANVTAGSLVGVDCTGPLTIAVRAGSARLDVRPSGVSTVRIESGSVDLWVQPGSDVVVRARVDLGELKVTRSDGSQRRVAPDGVDEVTVGAGLARLDVDVTMGSAKVRLP